MLILSQVKPFRAQLMYQKSKKGSQLKQFSLVTGMTILAYVAAREEITRLKQCTIENQTLIVPYLFSIGNSIFSREVWKNYARVTFQRLSKSHESKGRVHVFPNCKIFVKN